MTTVGSPIKFFCSLRQRLITSVPENTPFLLNLDSLFNFLDRVSMKSREEATSEIELSASRTDTIFFRASREDKRSSPKTYLMNSPLARVRQRFQFSTI